MDPVQIIIGALAGSIAKPIVEDAYKALKDLIKRKFSKDATLQVALDNFEKRPSTWQKPLEEALIAADAGNDPEIVSAAKMLYSRIQEDNRIVHAGTGDVLTDHARKITTGGDYIEGNQSITPKRDDT
ncbi:MAG: hypothetical protein M1282_02155 [Chloroflexi bacterium]|nr:hypothetical protein [Chloroflexota bacterium]